MGTYNLTKGDAAVAANDFGRFFCVKIPIVVADIIAADPTMTANGKITAADVIQLWDIPADTVLLVSMATFKVITGAGAGKTANVGIAAANGLFNAIDINTVGLTSVAKNAGYGTDNYGAIPYAATDTVDITFNHDAIAGSFELYIPGYKLE